MKLNSLIIDDDASFRVLLRKMVEKHDSLTIGGMAENGEQAMEMLNSKNIDLVFLDVQMPDMSGFDVLDAVKNIDPMQVIITSGSSAHGIKAFDYGITDYLVKPFTQERFEEAINRVLRNAERNQYTTTLINQILGKVLLYIHTRDFQDFRPIPSRESKLGYLYPMLTSNLDFRREEKALDILDMAEQEGFLTSTYIDSFYTCNNCYNSYLLFRETCPSCQSADVESEEQIHHFPCAYVGPISDFQSSSNPNALECPKCERILKHIGVDYDKPSIVFTCNRCDHIFQDPVVKAKCNVCSSDMNVESLLKKNLKSYQLTSLGRDAALGKVIIDLNEFDDMVDVIDKEYFQRLLSKEIERKKEAAFDSTIASFQLENISEIYEQIGNQNSKKLVREIFELVNSEINRSDEVVFQSMVTIWLLVTEKSVSEATPVIKRIEQRIKDLVDDNYSNFSLSISKNIKPVVTTKTASEQLQELNATLRDIS
ncbi:MAG: response regulator [Balneolaceae bacterium]|nr:response regulator [Balneolaceae bacterium]